MMSYKPKRHKSERYKAKKNNLIVVVGVLVIMVVCILFAGVWGKGLFLYETAASVSEADVSSLASSNTADSAPEGGDEEEELPAMFRYVPMMTEELPKPDIFVENNTGEWNGFRMTLENISFAKDTQGMGYPVYLSEKNGEKVDTQGTLISNHMYMLLTFTVENPKEYADTFDLSYGKPFFYIGEDRFYLAASNEIAIQNINNHADTKDRYQYTMQPGEKIQFAKGYIFSVDELRQAEELLIGICFNTVSACDDNGTELIAWDPKVAFVNATEMFKEALHEAGL